MGSATLDCESVCFSWGTQSVLDNISFNVREGELVSIIGPSGCGKSTLLSVLAGLVPPKSGSVRFEGLTEADRSNEPGIVFQDAGLFPWLSVRENVEFGPRMRGVARAERRRTSQGVLRSVGLLQDENKFPHQLSGGMKQRAAIARVLANESSFLLMDEPFGALDYQTRYHMQLFLLRIWKEYKKSILLVTHQVDEAVLLSDRILLMAANPGRITGELAVDMARPRDPTAVEFNGYRKTVTQHLENEVSELFS